MGAARMLVPAAVLAAFAAAVGGGLASARRVPWDPSPIPLTVRVVDGMTGLPLEAGGVIVGVPTADPWTLADAVRAVRLPGRWVCRRTPLLPGRRCFFAIDVLPPQGYARPTPLVGWLWIAPTARAAETDVPVFPEARIEVRAERPGVEVAWAMNDMDDFRPGGVTVADGTVRVAGVPFVPGGRVRLGRIRSRNLGTGSWAVGDVHLLRLGPAWARDLVHHVALDGSGHDVSHSACSETSEDEPCPPAAGSAHVEVLALRSDGSAAAGVHVVCAVGARAAPPDRRPFVERAEWTDSAGRAEFAGLPAGHVDVLAGAVGFGSARGEGEVAEGESAAFTLVEEPRRRIVVLAVDEEGNPVACAQAEVASPWYQRPAGCIDGDVQPLFFFTGSDGRLVLPGVPASTQSVGLALEGVRGGRAWTSDARDGVLTVRLTRRE